MNCVYPPHTGRVVNVTAHESEKKLVVLGALVPSIMHPVRFPVSAARGIADGRGVGAALGAS
jgi:NAD(P)H-dependent flavin oxidoreductase YrpB (nitropropane dioxygenase family)